MAATITTAKTVAPVNLADTVTLGAWGEGVELRWEGEEFYTGISLHDIDYGITAVVRAGKGDWLHVDLGVARVQMSPVMLGSGHTVAWLGLPLDAPVQVTTQAQRVDPNCTDWTEYPNMETALVALAFEHCS